MADAPRGGARGGGFGSRGDRGGDRGDRGRGRGRGRARRGANKNEEKEWQPVTKLGRLVKDGKIKSMEEIYLHSLPIKEYQIVDFFLPKLKDEVMKIKPVQKQTRAGQRTRFKAIVVIGDSEGHVGLGIKTSKEVATAIRAAIIIAKLSVLPIRRGYWGTNLGLPHSLPTKESGKCGSVSVRLIPAPRGTGLVASPAVKRLLQLAGVDDIYTSSSGSTKTLENTLKATFVAVGNTYGYLTPNLWKETKLIRSPLEEFGDVLRAASRLAAIAGIAALVLIGFYFGRGAKVDIASKDGFKVRRDGTTITFNLPWPPIREKLEVEKATSPILDGLLGSITNVAGEILDAGSSVADGVAQEGSGLSSSVLDGVNHAISDSTGIIGNVLGGASSLVENILATATGVSNIGILSPGSSNSETGPTSSPTQALNSVASLLMNPSSPSTVCPNGELTKSQHNCSTTQPSTMASFTASLPSLPLTISTHSATIIPSITCNDGAVVARTQECIDGISGSTSLLEFRTSPIPLDGKVLSSVAADIASALSDANGISGDLLSTVVAEITAAFGVGAGPITASSTIAAAIKAETTMVQNQIQTVVNGIPNILPVVATVINRVSTPLPVLNNPAGTLGLSLGLRGRRKVERSIETVATKGVCEENQDHECRH
ncbi:hypothetical protein B7494_g857 [Chlorociboria aeruginascens]|nr:hypothetical protein B7494_g857 [Chlorociboria aeruginascens]